MKKIFTLFVVMLASMMSFAAEPVAVVVTEAEFAFGEYGVVTINGTSTASQVVALEFYGWNGAGEYEAGGVMGKINNVEVTNYEIVAGVAPAGTVWDATVVQEGEVVTVTTTLQDAAGNLYALNVTGNEPKEEEKVYEPINILAYQMTVKANKWNENLELKAKDSEKNMIDIRLNTTNTEAYGDYGYTTGSSECGIVSARYKDITLTLNEEQNVAKYYKEGNNVCFEGVFNAMDSKQIYIIKMTSADEITSELENLIIQDNATKMIENGQLIIIKNGVKYNAIGGIVKE
jgi:hypothetical protein